jgi:hypothetical protein
MFADDTNIFYSNTKSKLSDIRTIQNKCIRNIFFANKTDNALPYYNLLNILCFDNIFKLKIAYNKFRTPQIFWSFTPRMQFTHTIPDMRQKQISLNHAYVRTNYGKFTFRFLAPKLWEEIPSEMKENKLFC